MGRWVKTALAAALACCFLTGMANAAEEKISVGGQEPGIEQIYINSPEIYVYGYGFEELKKDDVTGYLGDEKLQWVGSVPFKDSREGIYYYVLLDVSGSIPKAYFSEIKSGILNLQKRLREQDQLILCTFGEDVELVADGTQSAEQLEQRLSGLYNLDQKTLLFEGIDRAAGLADKVEPEECRRRVLLVISDGEDIAVGKKMAQEALDTLKEKGIPVYALCIQDADRNHINSFGEFARMSGGSLVTFAPEEGGTVLTGIQDWLSSFTELHFRSRTNHVSNRYDTFSLQIPGRKENFTREVMNSKWIPDSEPPVILRAEQTGSRQISIAFSEPVSGMEIAANYVVVNGKGPVFVAGVTYEKGKEDAVVLTTAEPLTDGAYTISCVNITDLSMEKNPLEQSVTISAVGSDTALPQNTEEDNTGIWFLIFLAIVALIIVLIVLYKKAHRMGQTETTVAEERAADRYRVIGQKPADRKMLEVVVTVEGRSPKKMGWEIEKSLIVGRANLCDIVFDDVQISRQHMALEWENGELFVTDLDTTNGTMVNGVRIYRKRELKPGDVICAGSVEMKISW